MAFHVWEYAYTVPQTVTDIKGKKVKSGMLESHWHCHRCGCDGRTLHSPGEVSVAPEGASVGRGVEPDCDVAIVAAVHAR